MKGNISLRYRAITLAALVFSMQHAFSMETARLYATGSASYLMNSVSAIDSVDPEVAGLDPQLFSTKQKDASTQGLNIGLGVHLALNKKLFDELGLQYTYNDGQQFEGDYYSLPVPPPDLTYQYTLRTQQILVDNKVFFRFNHQWSAYAELGLGLGILDTNAVNFTSTDIVSHTTPLNSNGKSRTQYIWQMGAGGRYQMNEHWALQAGITQAWWGTIKVPFNDGVQNQEFSGGNLTPLSITAGVSYVF